MLPLQQRRFSVMICLAIMLHVVWATTIALDESAVGSTAISALHRYIDNSGQLAATIAAAALLAVFGLWTNRPWVALLLIPQQILLCMSAAGAIEAMWLSQFADGVFRPRAFIIADQIYCPLVALGHTVAIVLHALRLRR